MITGILSDDMYDDNQSNNTLLDCKATVGNTTAHLLFAKEVIFEHEQAIQFKIQIHCLNESVAFDLALKKRTEIATVINDIVKIKVGDFGGLKDLKITRGSINLEGYLGWFDGLDGVRGYRDLKDFISDLFSIIPDIVRALANLFDFIVKGKPISEETINTSLSATVATVTGVALAPIIGPLALPISVAIYKFFKGLF